MIEQKFVRLSMSNIENILSKDESDSASRARATVKRLRQQERVLLDNKNIPALRRFYIRSKEALEILEESLHMCTIVI